MGSSSKRKGTRFEREVREFFENFLGVEAYRIPLSGAARGFKGDLIVPDVFGDRPVECKFGNRVPKTPYVWLGDNAALIMRRKWEPALIVMRLNDWAELVMRVAVEGVGNEH